MKNYLSRIFDVMVKQVKARNLSTDDAFVLRLLRLTEELGEVSRAHRDWSNHVPPKDRYVAISDELKYSLVEETVDCVISSLALFVATGANEEQFNIIFDAKLKKWEDNITCKKD